MTEHTPATGPHGDDELFGLAAAYALDAVDDAERRAIDGSAARAAEPVREEFLDRVRAHREALAEYSRTTAQQPPAGLFDAVLARIDAGDAPQQVRPGGAVQADGAAHPDSAAGPQPGLPAPASLDERRRRRMRWARGLGTAAAAAVLVAGGVAIGHRISGTESSSPTAQVFAASDVRTSAVDVGGGTATVVYSRDADAAVLLMNDVAAPAVGTNYQLWLMGPDHPPTSMGVMGPDDLSASTRAVLRGIETSTEVGISVEPPGGSAQPTDVLVTIGLT